MMPYQKFSIVPLLLKETLQVFYSTLCNSKTAQPENIKRQQRVGHSIIERFSYIQGELLDRTITPEDIKDSWVKELC